MYGIFGKLSGLLQLSGISRNYCGNVLWKSRRKITDVMAKSWLHSGARRAWGSRASSDSSFEPNASSARSDLEICSLKHPYQPPYQQKRPCSSSSVSLSFPSFPALLNGHSLKLGRIASATSGRLRTRRGRQSSERSSFPEPRRSRTLTEKDRSKLNPNAVSPEKEKRSQIRAREPKSYSKLIRSPSRPYPSRCSHVNVHFTAL